MDILGVIYIYRVMSAKKQPQTFCCLINFINQHDRALADIVAGQCNVGLLHAQKSKTGLTFLHPQDKAFMAKLDRLAYSANPDEANAAAELINAHIIRDKLKTGADWEAHRDDLPNALGQHVAIKSASDTEIIFENGARAVPDKRFVDASQFRNLSVWSLTGEIPVTKDKPATEKYLREALKAGKTRGVKRGGYQVETEHGKSLRYQIALAAENSYALTRATGVNSVLSIFQSYALSLIGFLCAGYRGEDRETLLERAIPLYTHHNVDFYFLLQPHEKVNTAFLIPSSVIEKWWKTPNRGNYGGAAALGHIKQYLCSARDNSGDTALTMNTAGRVSINGAIGKIRAELAAIRERSILTRLDAVYTRLETENRVGDCHPIYNSELAEYYSSNRGLKKIHDGLRFISHDMFHSLESEPEFDQGYYRDLLSIIGTALHTSSEAERNRVMGLFNESAMQYIANPADQIATLITFVQSTCFIQLAQTEDSAPQYNRSQLFRPKPLDKAIYNIDKALALQHERLLSAAPSGPDPDLLARLRALDPNTIDADLRAALARFA